MPPYLHKGALGLTFYNIQDLFTISDVCMRQTITVQSRTEQLSWLLRKSRPLRHTNHNIWGIFPTVGVWMINTDDHTKPEPSGCLSFEEKIGPFHSHICSWGPPTSTFGTYLLLWMWGWSMPITLPNQSQMNTLVGKKNQALCISILYRPLGSIYFKILG